jgi:hypothetical protein
LRGDDLIKRDKSCIISNNDYEECDAAHIVPLLDSNNYDVDNGLLLDKSLHSSYVLTRIDSYRLKRQTLLVHSSNYFKNYFKE